MKIPKLCVLGLLAAGILAAEIDSRFYLVKGWKGDVDILVKQKIVWTQASFQYTWDLSHSGTITFDLTSFDLKLGVWTGRAKGTIKITDSLQTNIGSCVMTTEYATVKQIDEPAFLVPADDGTYMFYPANAYIPVVGASYGCGTSAPGDTVQIAWFPFPPAKIKTDFPASGYTLNRLAEVEMPFPYDVQPSQAPAIKNGLIWFFAPTAIGEIEVLIEPAGYDQWRPEAGADETTAGNTINIKATVRKKDGSELYKKPKKIIFELTDTSAEPGVSMNYPVRGKARTTRDLQFDPDSNSKLDVTNNRQTAETKTSTSEPTEATAAVTSYDWGGWSKLKVSAEMPDGKKIEGHLKSDERMKEVLLPKRRADSFIAESWLQQHGLEDAKDDADDEGQPEGDGHKGDGFTLYEEYRGFHENGRHIEGDPAKKEYFLRDEVGDGARAGIAVFRSLTGFAVHDKLRKDEFPADRVMNGNHAQGAHVVEQHGVVMKWQELPTGWAGVSYSDPMQNPGPPKNTEVIYIASNNPIEFRSNVVRGALSRLDMTVTHEMLHTAGVWHHGQDDIVEVWTIAFPPNSQSDQPRFWVTPAFREILDEDDRDTLDRWLTPLRNNPVTRPLTEPGSRSLIIGPRRIGALHGENSGVDECVMRYANADGYPKLGAPGTRYVIDSQVAGGILCDQKQGTGNNDATHKPQSRHMDAEKGDCKHQLCVNDRYH